jgi:hypothetical protein
MKEQVLSIEQMKHLQGLGLDTSNASMCLCCFRENIDEEWELEIYEDVINQKRDSTFWEIIPTFTLQDIMQKLPPFINICMLHIYPAADLWYFVYMDSYTRTILSTKYSPDIMNAAYQMLCWVIENGHLETNK